MNFMKCGMDSILEGRGNNLQKMDGPESPKNENFLINDTKIPKS
jgi:hypothetical protein